MEARTLTGTVLGGRYRVGEMLGEGGMGAVYEAVQEGLDRKVALKVLHPHLSGDAELRGRFKREAHVVAMLGHPNVVQISDFQTNTDEPPFLVMERLRGENLRDVLKRTPKLASERVAYIAVQVLSALDAAHRANVVHRDIKPDNIFLERTNVQADIVKLLDFGVAKLLGEDEAGAKLTRSGLVVGTLSYMSPEQATGDPVDGRADLYSLGAVMYVALAGKKPFEGSSTVALLQAIMTQQPVPLRVVRPDVDHGLSDIVDRALAKRAGDRFASAAEMARALAPFVQPTHLDPPSVVASSGPAPTIRTIMEPFEDLQSTARLTSRSSGVPPTIAMSAAPESHVPRTTPLPPRTERASYHPPIAAGVPIQPIIAAAPPRKRRSRAGLVWILSIGLTMLVLAAVGTVLLVLDQP